MHKAVVHISLPIYSHSQTWNNHSLGLSLEQLHSKYLVKLLTTLDSLLHKVDITISTCIGWKVVGSHKGGGFSQFINFYAIFAQMALFQAVLSSKIHGQSHQPVMW